MNRALLNPFEVRDLPKGIEEFLEQPEKATCMRFNRHGNLLAVGTRTGTVVIWDFDTHSIATTLEAPQQSRLPVTSVSFPAPCNGSHVLVSYESGMVRVYATLTASLVTEVSFNVPVIAAVPHPKRFPLIAVVPRDSHPLLLHLQRGIYSAHEIPFAQEPDPETPIRIPSVMRDRLASSPIEQNSSNRPHHAFGNIVIPSMPNRSPHITMFVICAKDEFVDGRSIEGNAARRRSSFCITFTRGGRYMLRGGPSGIVRAFQLTDELEVPGTNYSFASCLSAVTIPGKAAVRSIQLSRRNEQVLINSQDRAMRLFDLNQLISAGAHKKTIEPKTNFTEIVNKSQCQSACFSRDGDFVLGGMEGTDHRIHVWRTADGFLDLTLEGPREGIVEILWHPLRPVIASLGSNVGGVYVWMKNFTENWSAFAAEFNELEANEEYKEAEDEFDLKDPENDEKRLEARERAEAKDVDVETVDASGWFSSDSDEDDTYFFVPADPKPDIPSNFRSLADEIMAQKMAEGGENFANIEEIELEGQEGGRESAPSDNRRRQRNPDERDSKPRQKRKICLRRRMSLAEGNNANLEHEITRQAAVVPSGATATVENHGGGKNDSSDIELDGGGPHGVPASNPRHHRASTEGAVEEEVLENGQYTAEAQ